MVDLSLSVDPIEETRPLPLRGLGITGIRRRVACSRDLGHDDADVLTGPAVDPNGEFCPVAVETAEDDDERDGFVLGGARREVIVEGDFFAFVG